MMQHKWFSPALIVLLGVVVYANSLQNGFTFDDWPLIAQNAIVKLHEIGAVFTSPYWPNQPELGLYRPLTTLSYVVNHWVLGEGAFGFHLVNVVLHILNALLVYWGLKHFLERPYATLGALIFLLHPLQTEAVNGIVGRAELLAGFWMLIAWNLYAGSATKWRWVWVSLAVLLGCLSKESAVTIVGVLAPGAFLRLHSRENHPNTLLAQATTFFKESLGGILACLGAVFVFLMVRYAVVGGFLLPQKPSFLDNPLAYVGDWERVLTALSIVWRYAVLMLWPGDFSADYSYNAVPVFQTLWAWQVWGGLVVVGLLSGLVVRGVCNVEIRGWAIAASWLVMPALLVVNLLFPIGTTMAERLMYVPMVGYSVLGSLCFLLFGRRWPKAAVGVGVVLLIALGKNTVLRNRDWKSDLTLFQSAVNVVPQSAKAHFNLGNAVRDQGDLQAALPHYHRALGIYPDYAEVHYNIGVVWQDMGRQHDALLAYQNALSVQPDHVNALINAGVLFAQQRSPEKALQSFQRAIELAPKRLDIRFNLALVYIQLGNVENAILTYKQVLAQDPKHEDAAINLADLYVHRGENQLAIGVLQSLVEHNRLAHQAALNLGTLLEKQKRFEEAAEAFLLASEGQAENNILALLGAGRLYAKIGKSAEAVRVLDLFLARWQGDVSMRAVAEKMRRQLAID